MQFFCIFPPEKIRRIKRYAAAALALLTLCSCGAEFTDEITLSETEAPITEEETEPEIIFTGIPDIPDRISRESSRTETTAAPVTSTATEAASTTELNAAPAETQPPTEAEEPKIMYFIDVPYFSQEDYPTGCELVSTSMLLAYYGFDISAGELVSGGYIETCELTEDPADKNILHGGDPNKVFIGDPYDEAGYGCYSGAILAGLRRYLDNEFFDAVDLSGISLSDLCMEYIDFGEPVLVWASLDMEPTFRTEINTWIIDETGEIFTWTSNEHCMVLVGYDEEYYCFHDPQKGACSLYPRELAEQRFRELGSQAITIHPW